MKKAIFLDRDGVINFDSPHYIKDISEVKIIPDVAKYLSLLKESGFLLIIITNQSAVGRGIITEQKLHEINSYIITQLKKNDVLIDGLYFCPHSPVDECECRKPKPGLIFQATNDFDIDLRNSWMIGDKESDIIAGKQANCRTYLNKQNSSLKDAISFILSTSSEK